MESEKKRTFAGANEICNTMRQNFYRDGKKFVSRCSEISIGMEILRYHDANLQPPGHKKQTGIKKQKRL